MSDLDNSAICSDTFNENKQHDFFHFLKAYDLEDYYISDPDFTQPSSFYSEDEYIRDCTKQKSKLKMISINIQSLNAKLSSLKEFLSQFPSKESLPDVIALQEIWTIHVEDIFHIDGYRFLYKERKRQGGGVGFYIKDIFTADVIRDDFFLEGIFESITVSIKMRAQSLNICSFYKPNNYSVITKRTLEETFIQHFEKYLQTMREKNVPLVLLGDSNLNLFKLNEDDNVLNYINTFLSEGFFNIINKTTRVCNKKFSLLDHILVDFKPLQLSSGIMIDSLSDHYHPFLNFDFFENKPEPKEYSYKRCFSSHRISGFKECLKFSDWHEVYSKEDPNECYSNFIKIFKAQFDSHFPLKPVKKHLNTVPQNPFMTKALLISRKKKLALHKRFKSKPTNVNKEKYTTYRNMYNRLIRTSKKMYIENQLLLARGDSKKIWKILKEAADMKTKVMNSIDGIFSGDDLLTNQSEMADAFNDYFARIGPEKAKTVPRPVNNSFTDFLPNQSTNTFFFNPISYRDILDAVETLKGNSSCDINGISGRLIKEVIHPIAEVLSHIFNLCVEKGVFPDSMKTSRTVPIFKQEGSPKDCTNYRPISIIDSFSKIFEKCIYIRMKSFLNKNNFFHINQYGFREGRNVQQAVIKATNFISKAINENEIVVGVFLDVSKAFDTVNRNILIKKLENCGFRGPILNLLKSYLSGRIQKVSLNESVSKHGKLLELGVLQGSILAALLFIVYINDFPKCNEGFCITYADDTTCLFKAKSIAELMEILDRNLPKIFDWYCANELALNVKKTNYMIFSLQDKIVNEFPTIMFNGSPINKISKLSPVKTVRLLGVQIDQNLNFEDFAKRTLSKLAKSFFIIKRAKNYIPESSLKLLYFALFHSHLEFASYFLLNNNKKISNKICVMQRKIIRILAGFSFTEHTSQAFIDLNILPFNKLIEFNVLKFMWKYECNKLPDGFSNEWPRITDLSLPYNFRNDDELLLQRTISIKVERMTYFSYIKLWNEKKYEGGRDFDADKYLTALKANLLHANRMEKKCSLRHCYACQKTNDRLKSAILKFISSMQNL